MIVDQAPSAVDRRSGAPVVAVRSALQTLRQ
jgi:hypothetical protein